MWRINLAVFPGQASLLKILGQPIRDQARGKALAFSEPFYLHRNRVNGALNLSQSTIDAVPMLRFDEASGSLTLQLTCKRTYKSECAASAIRGSIDKCSVRQGACAAGEGLSQIASTGSK
ncbi:MAG: hypothetical protein ABJA80_02225 [bacterium]